MAGNIKVGGNTIFTHTGAVGAGTVTLKDQSGNAILTDDGTTVAIGNVDTATVGSNALVVDASGNVGMGIASPVDKLDVRSSGTAYGSGYIVSRHMDSTGNKGVFLGYDADELAGTIGGANFLTFQTYNGGWAEAMRIDPSGHVIIPNGVTLGTAVGTYNAANTLDDYEEGTWTPSLSGNSTAAIAGTPDGVYTKIGNMVYASFEIRLNSNSDSSSYRISSLPFTIGSTESYRGGIAQGWQDSGNDYISNGPKNGTEFHIYRNDGTYYSFLDWSGKFLKGTFIYRV